MNRPPLNLLVALPAEAKPLIRALALRRLQADGPCPLYINEKLSLALSGPGRDAMTRAVHHLNARSEADSRWLNLGIAGHASLALGECLQAVCVVDALSDQQWKLQTVDGLAVPTGTLRCVAEAETDYKAAEGYDMESAAFASTLATLGALDRTYALKIISDNPQQPITGISGRMVGELIEKRLHVIQRLIAKLC